MLLNLLENLIDILFDFSYEINFDEALVFYFFYIIFGYFLLGLLNFIFDALPIIQGYSILIPFIALFLYPLVAISIFLKKKLKDWNSFYLVFFTIVMTLFVPIVIAIYMGWGAAFAGWFFIGSLIGCIPPTILKVKDNYSLNIEVQQMEQEKLEQARRVEKQLLIERIIRMKQEKIKDILDNKADED